jgi:hypothetical protein
VPSEEHQLAHLEAGYLAVAGERVTSLDVEVPDGSWNFGILPWSPMTPEERAEVEAQLAEIREATKVKNQGRGPL